MNMMLLIACTGLVSGFFMIFSISPFEFTNALFNGLISKPKRLKDEVNAFTQRKKKSYLRREVTDIHNILKITGRERWFPVIATVSLALFALGSSLAILLGNIFAVPVLGFGFMLFPLWYVRLTQTHFKRAISAELETALSIITTAYLRNEDIVTAIDENLEYLNEPVLSVFKTLSYKVKMIHPDMTLALLEMKERMDNAVFREWCDAVIACQHDRSLKTTLTPIVSKLSDMRVVNGELENLVFEPRKEFITMQLLVIGNIPLLYFLNKDWYQALMHTPLGQIILTVCFIAIFVCAAFVIRLTEPIEYRR